MHDRIDTGRVAAVFFSIPGHELRRIGFRSRESAAPAARRPHTASRHLRIDRRFGLQASCASTTASSACWRRWPEMRRSCVMGRYRAIHECTRPRRHGLAAGSVRSIGRQIICSGVRTSRARPERHPELARRPRASSPAARCRATSPGAASDVLHQCTIYIWVAAIGLKHGLVGRAEIRISGLRALSRWARLHRWRRQIICTGVSTGSAVSLPNSIFLGRPNSGRHPPTTRVVSRALAMSLNTTRQRHCHPDARCSATVVPSPHPGDVGAAATSPSSQDTSMQSGSTACIADSSPDNAGTKNASAGSTVIR